MPRAWAKEQQHAAREAVGDPPRLDVGRDGGAALRARAEAWAPCPPARATAQRSSARRRPRLVAGGGGAASAERHERVTDAVADEDAVNDTWIVGMITMPTCSLFHIFTASRLGEQVTEAEVVDHLPSPGAYRTMAKPIAIFTRKPSTYTKIMRRGPTSSIRENGRPR